MNYQEFNVTNYLPTRSELVDIINGRNGKAAKTRFINEEIHGATETRKELAECLKGRFTCMLHGAIHTEGDLVVLDSYIKLVQTLKK
jgi:hypothetical protein